jgi:hypothetical protein
MGLKFLTTPRNLHVNIPEFFESNQLSVRIMHASNFVHSLLKGKQTFIT